MYMYRRSRDTIPTRTNGPHICTYVDRLGISFSLQEPEQEPDRCDECGKALKQEGDEADFHTCVRV